VALWEADHLVGAALGSLRQRPDGLLIGGPRLLLIAPELRGRGHGSHLLAELEVRLAAAGARELWIGQIAPNYLWPGLEPRDTAALCLLQRRGYERAGEAINMEVELSVRPWWTPDDERHVSAQGWTLRRATAADADTLGSWAVEQFSASWAWEVRLACAATPPTAFLVERDGTIGGFACHSVSGLAGCFGPTGTAPELRGLGFGRALLLRCLADLRTLGFERIEIGWVGPVSFYSRSVGAVVSRVFWSFVKPAGR
jgi:GNAT superfamily N-acetyltransferase